MISIEGKYSFTSLAALISSPSVPSSLSRNLEIECLDPYSKTAFSLTPLNPCYSQMAWQIDEFPAITFILQNVDFQIIAKYLLLQKIDSSFELVLLSGRDNISENLHSAVSQTLLNFLNVEFDTNYLCAHVDLNESNIEEGFSSESLIGYLEKETHENNLIHFESEAAQENILTAGPSISILESAYVSEATKNGWNAHHSDYLNRFETEFAEYVGVKHAMATSSCTGALHLSLLALGIGVGDEVLVPDITWVATASAIRYVGAKPIFVDIDKSTWTIDVNEARKLITPHTKAIMPVHLYGYGAPMPEIIELASAHNLAIVEDAAPAIGTLVGDRFAGTFGDFGCYSFQGAKLLVTGEGGMLVTNDSELFAKAKKIQDHGRKPGTFWIEELGHKYKMNNITAALGLGQVQRAENQIHRKRRINQWYRDSLSDLPGLSFQNEALDTRSICWMTSFTIDPERGVSRDELISELKKCGVDSRPVFPSISQYKIWGYEAQVPSNSKYIGDNGINLPSGVMLSQHSVEKVIGSIRSILK